MEPEKKTGKLPCIPVLVSLMILVPLLIAAGCTGKSPVPSMFPLNGTEWTLTGYVPNGTTLEPLDGTTVTMVFDNTGQITGSAGCNRYFAGYEMKGTAVTIGPAGSTAMYCSGQGVMDQESTYLALLGRVASAEAKNSSLTFSDAKGSPILSFARAVPPAPAPLAGTNWTLGSFSTADTVSSVIAGTTINAVFDQNGEITGSAGCNHYFASYTTTGTALSVGSAGSTKMHCTGPAGVMIQESSYLTSLGKSASYTITGNRLDLADAKGTTLLSFTRES
jgi:heat shock protein HslJ